MTIKFDKEFFFKNPPFDLDKDFDNFDLMTWSLERNFDERLVTTYYEAITRLSGFDYQGLPQYSLTNKDVLRILRNLIIMVNFSEMRFLLSLNRLLKQDSTDRLNHLSKEKSIFPLMMQTHTNYLQKLNNKEPKND